MNFKSINRKSFILTLAAVLGVSVIVTAVAGRTSDNSVPADNKKLARLNCISHLLSQIPYETIPSEKIRGNLTLENPNKNKKNDKNVNCFFILALI